LRLVPGFSCLVLRRDDFEMRHVWRCWFFRWDEVTDLAVVKGAQGLRVAWNMKQPDARSSTLLREWYGRDSMLIDNYGVSAGDVCAMMNERREKAVGAVSLS